jgi:hypothetical protein
MKKWVVNILALALFAFLASAVRPCSLGAAAKDIPDLSEDREHQIKAAFIYNFAQFSDWPRGKPAEPNTITIGLLGDHTFENAFGPIKDKLIQNKRVEIVSFGKFFWFIDSNNSGKLQLTSEAERLRKCHLLFVCDSEKKYYSEIISVIKDFNVLTVGETEDFLDAGGIITFIPGTEKPVFEINQVAAKQAEIRISSRVLRLARKVIGEKSSGVETLIEQKWLAVQPCSPQAVEENRDYSKLL